MSACAPFKRSGSLQGGERDSDDDVTNALSLQGIIQVSLSQAGELKKQGWSVEHLEVHLFCGGGRPDLLLPHHGDDLTKRNDGRKLSCVFEYLLRFHCILEYFPAICLCLTTHQNLSSLAEVLQLGDG